MTSTKKKNCDKGHQCGYSCITRTKLCKKDEGEQTTGGLNVVSAHIVALSSEVPINQLHEYFAGPEHVIFEQNEGIFKDKTAAVGMQAYFGAEYPLINKFLYDSEYAKEAPEDIKMKAMAAIYGFSQLPKHSKQEIIDNYAAKGVTYDGETLYRGMSFGGQEQLDSYLSQHIEGETIVYDSFTSTTLANPEEAKKGEKLVDGGWSRKPIQVVIKQKEESGGRWVDQRKRSKDEAEILFKPGAKFKVEKIETETRERLPDRLREPLQKLWGPSDGGGGVGNLPISAMLGEASPEEFMQREEFAFFRQFMRKRNVPAMAEWPNLTLGDILNVSGMRGGRFAVMNELTKALSSQVKPEEKTGKTEISSAKIFLREID